MRPTSVLSVLDGPNVGPKNLAIRVSPLWKTGGCCNVGYACENNLNLKSHKFAFIPNICFVPTILHKALWKILKRFDNWKINHTQIRFREIWAYDEFQRDSLYKNSPLICNSAIPPTLLPVCNMMYNALCDIMRITLSVPIRRVQSD